MNSNDLYDWKRHPVTQAVFGLLQARIASMTSYLLHHAGDDSLKDKQFCGAIMAHNDLLNIQFEDIEESQE